MKSVSVFPRRNYLQKSRSTSKNVFKKSLTPKLQQYKIKHIAPLKERIVNLNKSYQDNSKESSVDEESRKIK